MKPKVVFVSEAIRRDSHAPLRFLRDFEVVHFFCEAPYGDMSPEDYKGARQVDLKDMYAAIVKEKPAIIQGAEPFGSRRALRLSWISNRAARATGAKLVVPILENRPISARFNRVQRAVLRLVCPKIFASAAAVVVLNRGAQTNVRSYFRQAKIKRGIIWGVWGVDSDLFRPRGKREQKSMLYVGRLVEDKGLRYLLEGFRKAAQKIPKLRLRLAGSGPLLKELKAFVKKNNLSGQVEFLGVIKNVELPSFFSRADLCVYPSITMPRWEEQVGTVNFQALACGTPVLTTMSGAIPEYIKEGEGALLVKQRSAAALAAAIVKYYSDRKLRERLQSSARQVARKYDIKNEVGKAGKLFWEILDEKK